MDKRKSGLETRPAARPRWRVLSLFSWWRRPPPRLELSEEDEQLLRRFGIDPSDVGTRPGR